MHSIRIQLITFIAAVLLIFLVIAMTGLNLSNTNLEMILSELPSWAEIRQFLSEAGVLGRVTTLFFQGILAVVLGTLSTCLHFYAAMSLGHMFSKDKILLSIVFFVGISFVLSLMTTGYGAVRIDILDASYSMHTAAESIRFGKAVLGEMLLVELLQSAVLYAATVLSLKKGLNPA